MAGKVYTFTMEQPLESYKYLYVPVNELDKILPEVEGYIRRGLGDEITYEQIVQALMDQDITLWIVWKNGIIAVYITRVSEFHGIRYYEVIAMSGKDVLDWLDPALENVEKTARGLGVDRLRFMGRDGWLKMFQKRGFEKTHIVMQKVL